MRLFKWITLAFKGWVFSEVPVRTAFYAARGKVE